MFDIITIGSATKDIFLGAEKLRQGNCLCLPLGEKIELENVFTFSGGGGVNAATTFALQGLNTAFCGVVGQDIFGQEIIEELNEKGIGTEMVKVKPGKLTDLGLIFQEKTERTILLHHGASKSFSEKDIDWEKLGAAKWLYIAPLWGKAAGLTQKLVDFAKENNVRVALNPSIDQIALPGFKKIIKNIRVLILNDNEASFLAKVKPYQEKKVFEQIYPKPGIGMEVVVTKGREGASVFDGKILYQMPAPKVKIIDATGAGDSFGSGFVAGLIQTHASRFQESSRSRTPGTWKTPGEPGELNIEKAMQLGMANAISNIQVFGANKGLLKRGERFTPIKINKERII